MSNAIKISTGDYKREGKVEVDGKIWTAKLPGAGTELRLSQAFRNSKLYGSRLELLNAKIDSGTATEADLDNYEEYSEKFAITEQTIYDFFTTMFTDETEDNAEVKEWVYNTPTSIIAMAFEDIKSQANDDQSGTES